MFALFVDTSPSVILAPATFADHIQHTEEYRQTPLSGTYLRGIRYIGILISLFLTPLWLALLEAGALRGILALLVPAADVSVNIYLQVALAEVGVEFLRMASIHTPNALSTAMGLIAGYPAGRYRRRRRTVFRPDGPARRPERDRTYATPSYELGLANKISKMFFILATFLLGTGAGCGGGIVVRLFVYAEKRRKALPLSARSVQVETAFENTDPLSV